MRISVQIQLGAPPRATLVYLLDMLYPSLVKGFEASVQIGFQMMLADQFCYCELGKLEFC